MIKLDVLPPSEFNRAPVPCTDIVCIETSFHLGTPFEAPEPLGVAVVGYFHVVSLDKFLFFSDSGYVIMGYCYLLCLWRDARYRAHVKLLVTILVPVREAGNLRADLLLAGAWVPPEHSDLIARVALGDVD